MSVHTVSSDNSSYPKDKLLEVVTVQAMQPMETRQKTVRMRRRMNFGRYVSSCPRISAREAAVKAIFVCLVGSLWKEHEGSG